MKRQSVYIIALLAAGSLFSTVYAASTIISDSGIITTNLTVSGTCTGCGASEGNYASYSVFHNATVGAPFSSIEFLHVGDDGSILAYNNVDKSMIVDGTGALVVVSSGGDAGTNSGIFQHGQSITGKYKMYFDGGVNNIEVYKNNVFLQEIGINLSDFRFSNLQSVSIGISSSGQYIVLFGEDGGGVLQREVILKGS